MTPLWTLSCLLLAVALVHGQDSSPTSDASPTSPPESTTTSTAISSTTSFMLLVTSSTTSTSVSSSSTSSTPTSTSTTSTSTSTSTTAATTTTPTTSTVAAVPTSTTTTTSTSTSTSAGTSSTASTATTSTSVTVPSTSSVTGPTSPTAAAASTTKVKFVPVYNDQNIAEYARIVAAVCAGCGLLLITLIFFVVISFMLRYSTRTERRKTPKPGRTMAGTGNAGFYSGPGEQSQQALFSNLSGTNIVAGYSDIQLDAKDGRCSYMNRGFDSSAELNVSGAGNFETPGGYRPIEIKSSQQTGSTA